MDESSELLDAVNRHVLSFFDGNEFSLTNLASWECAVHSGKECSFRGRGGGAHSAVDISVTITLYAADGAAVVSVFRANGNGRELLESFMPSLNKIDVDVREGLAKALTKTGIIKLPQLLQIRLIRNAILDHLGVRDFLRLEASSHLLKDVASLKEVDNHFWRQALKRKFALEQRKEGSYRVAYADEAKKRKEESNRAAVGTSSLLIETHRPRRPQFPGYYPDPIDPFGGGMPDPFQRPDPFGGPSFGGPGTGSEIFPSRAPLLPQPRGPPGGGMGPAGWPSFDRGGFI